MICTKCQTDVADHLRNCPACQRDAGFPNVKYAMRAAEVAELGRRSDSADASADSKGARPQLDSFRLHVASSQAVLNRSLGDLHSWINDRKPLWFSFQIQVQLGRTPQDNDYDHARGSVGELVNPHVSKHINYAALSLDDTGMDHYGSYTVVLKELQIDDRASVFEENEFEFVRRHHIVPGVKAVPSGYRAVWENRSTLAAAKLHPKITSTTVPADYQSILMEPRGSTPTNDFVEVHIYGAMDCSIIHRVVGPAPSRRADRSLWTQTKRALADLGAEVVET